MMNPLRKPGHFSRFRQLPANERWLLLNALILLPLTKIGLRMVGYRRWCRLQARWLLPLREPGEDLRVNAAITPQRAAELVYAAGRVGILTGACLERAIVLWWLLRRRNFPAEVCIGARKEAGQFEAHAWVQLDGAVLHDDLAPHYAPLDNFADLSQETLR